jgi:hypothetical protein
MFPSNLLVFKFIKIQTFLYFGLPFFSLDCFDLNWGV